MESEEKPILEQANGHAEQAELFTMQGKYNEAEKEHLLASEQFTLASEQTHHIDAQRSLKHLAAHHSRMAKELKSQQKQNMTPSWNTLSTMEPNASSRQRRSSEMPSKDSFFVIPDSLASPSTSQKTFEELQLENKTLRESLDQLTRQNSSKQWYLLLEQARHEAQKNAEAAHRYRQLWLTHCETCPEAKRQEREKMEQSLKWQK